MSLGYKNIARVVRPHGSKGEVVVAELPGLPFLVREGMRVHLTPPALKRERVSTVESVRESAGGALVRFSCASSLDDAESLSGCYVLASTDDFELSPLQTAVDDVLGRPVVDERRGPLGHVRDVMETPAHDVWSIDGGGFGEVLMPVVEAMVDEIPDDGPIFVHIPDGLLNL